MRLKLIIICLFTTLCSSFILIAEGSLINFQGLLLDNFGNAVVREDNLIVLNLYNKESGGSILYTERFPGVKTDIKGLYSIYFGQHNIEKVFAENGALWIELLINEEVTSPRHKMNAVPYALSANSASQLVDASDSNIKGTLDVTGRGTFKGLRAEAASISGHLIASDIHTPRITVSEEADFKFADEVLVPTPIKGSGAANKAYVDEAIKSLDLKQNEDNAEGISDNSMAITEEIVIRASADRELSAKIDELITGDTVFSGNPVFSGIKGLPKGALDWDSKYYDLDIWGAEAIDLPQYATVNVKGLLNADVLNVEALLRVGNVIIGEDLIKIDKGYLKLEGDIIADSLEIMGDIASKSLRASHTVDFGEAKVVKVPTPKDKGEAANKGYVDQAISTIEAPIEDIAANTKSINNNSNLIHFEGMTREEVDKDLLSKINTLSSRPIVSKEDLKNAFESSTYIMSNTAHMINNTDLIHLEGNAREAADNELHSKIDRIVRFDQAPTEDITERAAKALPSGSTDWDNNYLEIEVEKLDASKVPESATANINGLLSADALNAEKLIRVGDLTISDNRIRSKSSILFDSIISYDFRVMFGWVDFLSATEVRVPKPAKGNEATNKAYVDEIVIPSGGIILWERKNQIPPGWSNAKLSCGDNAFQYIMKD